MIKDLSQIWLNLPNDDGHFFDLFVWIIATLAKSLTSQKKAFATFLNR
jgi:hypothetical protein